MTESAFDVTRRGYDRDQVDDRIRALSERLVAAEQERSRERERAAALEAQLQDGGSGPATAPIGVEQGDGGTGGRPPGGGDDHHYDGFGVRAEKVLRLAEQLAADTRDQASGEAAATVERARADAEKHRHETEQTLIARATAQDQEAARRQAELDEREQQMIAQLAAAREKAEEIRAGAVREADRVRQEAKATATALRHEAEAAIREDRDGAEKELARLGGVRAGVRAEMARLREALVRELDVATPAVADEDDRGDQGGTGDQDTES